MTRNTNEERHRAVLDVAISIVRDKGIHGTSLNDIAIAAGISKSTLFHYFASKADLVERIQHRLSEVVGTELRAVAEDETLDPPQRLRALLQLHAHHCVERVSSPVLVAFMQVWGDPSSEHGRRQTQSRNRYEQIFVDAFEEGVASGAFIPRDARVATLGLLGQLTWLALWYQPDRYPELSTVVDELLDMAFTGLLAPAPPRRRSRSSTPTATR